MTALRAEGCGIARRAMSIKPALRIYLSASYGMISILLIGSLRSLSPLSGFAGLPPVQGGRIGRSILSCRNMALLLSTHSPTACGGKVVAPATKGGCISDARRAVVKVLL